VGARFFDWCCLLLFTSGWASTDTQILAMCDVTR
jgi:hypothetical protein